MKALKETNSSYVSYTHFNKLKVNKAYQAYAIYHTDNEKYGKGLMLYMKDKEGQKSKAQITPKYLKTLKEKGLVDLFMADIKFLFIVYRETLSSGSYRVDFIDKVTLQSFPSSIVNHPFATFNNIFISFQILMTELKQTLARIFKTVPTFQSCQKVLTVPPLRRSLWLWY